MAEPLKRKPVTLEKFFKAANPFVEIRRHAKSVWELSRDAEGVAEWCLTRLERGLFDPCGDVDEKSLSAGRAEGCARGNGPGFGSSP